MTSKSQTETEHKIDTPEAVDPLSALNTPEEIDTTPEADPRIKAFVEEGLRKTQEKPRKWFRVILPETEVKRVTKQAKDYARQTGKQFRISAKDKNGNPWPAGHLVYRVTAKIQRETTANPEAA